MLPGITKILPGKIAASPTKGMLTFCRALKAHLLGVSDHENAPPVRALAFDLETGAGDNSYGVSRSKAALSGAAGQVLLGGVLSHTFSKATQFGLGDSHENERQLLVDFFEKLRSAHDAGITLVGHNVMGFDCPFLMGRAHELGIPFPVSLIKAMKDVYSSRRNGLIDTFHLFDMSKFGAYQHGTSLGALARLWRGEAVEFGAHFGEMWANAGNRPALKHYNWLDLFDSLWLATSSGILDSLRRDSVLSLYENPATLPFGRIPLDACDAPVIPSLPRKLDLIPDRGQDGFCWMEILTAPLPGSWEAAREQELNSTKKTKSKSVEAALSKKMQSARMTPAASRIIGYAFADETGQGCVINTDDEFQAILGVLEFLHLRHRELQVVTSSVAAFRHMLCVRASCYNVILDPWVAFPEREWMLDPKTLTRHAQEDSLAYTPSRHAIRLGIVEELDEIPDEIPYYHSDIPQYDDLVRGLCAIWRDWWSTHPAAKPVSMRHRFS